MTVQGVAQWEHDVCWWSGATGRSFSDFDTIIESLRSKVLTLPAGETDVYGEHGDATLISDEAPHLEEWIARGY